MPDKETDTVDVCSYYDIKELVEAYRNPEQDFSSFDIFLPFTLVFDQREPIQFLPGDRVTHYGRRAIFLACFNSSTHSVRVKKDGVAEVVCHDLVDPRVFNTWIQAAWRL